MSRFQFNGLRCERLLCITGIGSSCSIGIAPLPAWESCEWSTLIGCGTIAVVRIAGIFIQCILRETSTIRGMCGLMGRPVHRVQVDRFQLDRLKTQRSKFRIRVRCFFGFARAVMNFRRAYVDHVAEV